MTGIKYGFVWAKDMAAKTLFLYLPVIFHRFSDVNKLYGPTCRYISLSIKVLLDIFTFVSFQLLEYRTLYT